MATDVSLPKTDDKVALVYTKMNGRMAGESFTIDWYDDKSTAIKDDSHFNRKKELPIFENDDFFNAIKHGGNYEFYSIVG